MRFEGRTPETAFLTLSTVGKTILTDGFLDSSLAFQQPHSGSDSSESENWEVLFPAAAENAAKNCVLTDDPIEDEPYMKCVSRFSGHFYRPNTSCSRQRPTRL